MNASKNTLVKNKITQATEKSKSTSPIIPLLRTKQKIKAINFAKFILMICMTLLFGVSYTQTYNSVAAGTNGCDGSWNDSDCWSCTGSGCSGTPGDNVGNGVTVNVNHDMMYDEDNSLEVTGGDINVNGVTLTMAEGGGTDATIFLRSGSITVTDGALLWNEFGCMNNGILNVEGGTFTSTNSVVDVHQDWSSKGGVSTFTNSCLRTGQNFTNDSGGRVTLNNSCVEIGIHGSGNYKNVDILTIEGEVQFLHGARGNNDCDVTGSGNFDNDGTINGSGTITQLEVGDNINNNSTWSVPTEEFCGNNAPPTRNSIVPMANCAGLVDVNCTACDPANSDTCPDITSLTDPDDICQGENFADITAGGFTAAEINQTTLGGPFGIAFRTFTGNTAPTNPYMGGSSLGAIVNADLSNSDTEATLSSVGSTLTAGTYQICAILSPTPSDADCRPSQCVTVVVNPLPNATLAVSDDAICAGEDGTITVSNSVNGVSYQLRLNSDDANVGDAQNGNGGDLDFTVSPDATTMYNVFATITATGCTAELADIATVTVNPLPDATLAVSDDVICAGEDGTITVSNSVNGVSYQLRLNSDDSNAGAAQNGNGGNLNFTVSPDATTMYNVLATITATGCTAELTDIATVTVNALPTSPQTPTNDAICANETSATVTIDDDLETNEEFRWWDAATGGNAILGTQPNINMTANRSSIEVTNAAGGVVSLPTAGNTLTLYVERFNSSTGCVSARIPVTITVNALPTNIMASPTCAGDAGTITVNSPTGNFEYSINGTDFQDSNVFSGVADGTYTVTVREKTTLCTAILANVMINCPASLEVTKVAGAAADGEPLEVSPGTNVTYTYEIENTGDVDLDITSISDNPHGNILTDGTFVSGDTDSDDILDTDETWTYTLVVNNITADVTNIVTVNANPVDEDGNDLEEDDGTMDMDDAEVDVQAPAIAVTKGSSLDRSIVAPADEANPGDQITYTYVVTNTGDFPLSNVTLTELDAAPDFWTGNGTAPSPSFVSGDANNNNMLDLTETWTYTATYTLLQSDINQGSIENKVRATGQGGGETVMDDSDSDNTADGGPGEPDEDDPTETPIPEAPSISIVKGSNLDLGTDRKATVGDMITYTYVVTNTGNVTLTNVTVNEVTTGPNAFTGTGTTPNPTFMSSTDNSTGNGTLLVGESATYMATYALTQDDIDAGQVDNQAIATGNSPEDDTVEDASDSSNPSDPNETGDPNDPEEDDPTGTPIPSISIVKGSNLNLGTDGKVTVGDIITYTYVVTNTGNVTLTNVTVNEVTTGPDAFTGTGTTPNPTFMSSTDDSTGDGTLLAGESATYTATYALTQDDIDAGQVDNQAIATGDSPEGDTVEDDSDSSNPSDPNETGDPSDPEEDDPTGTPIPGISIVKGSNLDLGTDGKVTVGDIITYTYVVTNTGNVTLTNVTVNEVTTGPDAFTGTGTTPNPTFMSSTDDSTGDGTLLAGESATYTATYALTQDDIDAGQVDNQAIATGDSPEGDTVEDDSDSSNPNDPNETGDPNDPEEDDPTGTPIPSISIVKGSSLDLGADGITVGDIITYTYVVTNNGNVTLTNVTVSEVTTGPNAFSGTGTTPNPVFSSSTMGSAAGILLVGESATYTATYAITAADINAGQVDNQAVATGDSPEGDTVEDDSDSSNPNDPNETGDPSDPEGGDPTGTPIIENPAITIVKGSSLDLGADGMATVGDVITYTYVVTNTGNVTLNEVSVIESVPNFTGTGTPPSPVFNSSSMGSAAGTLLVGESATYTATYAITQVDINRGQVDNQAVATGETPTNTEVEDDSDSSNPNDPNETGRPNNPDEDDPTGTIIPPPVPVEPIPTMSEWGLIIFGLLILNLAVYMIRRKEDLIRSLK